MPVRIELRAPRSPGDGAGGAERHLADLARVLSSIGGEVSFSAARDAPPPTPIERLVGHVVPLLVTPLASRRLELSGRGQDADVVMTVELMGVGVRRPRHLHLFLGSYVAFRRRALSPSTPVRALARVGVTALARVLENATQGPQGAVANSDALRAALADSGVRVRPEVILPPTDTSHFRIRDREEARHALGLPRDGRLLLFAGRWEYAKGADRVQQLLAVLPESWAVLLACPSSASWPWPDRRVCRLLDVPHATMPLVYAAADALLQPSRFEGYSLVVSEAQASGRPVLSSDVGHAAHLRSGPPLVRAGVVLAADDPAAWLRALETIAGDDASLQRAGAEAREYAERTVSYEAVAARWYGLLSHLYPDLPWHPPR